VAGAGRSEAGRFAAPHRYSRVANQDPDEPHIIHEVTQTSFSGTYSLGNLGNLEKLPDAARKLFPPDLLRQMASQLTDPLGFAALHRSDPAFDESAFMQRAVTIIGATRMAEQDGQWDMARPFLSARFFRRWQPWAQGLRASGVPRPSNVSRHLAAASVHSEAAYDCVTIRVGERSMPSTQPPVSTLWTFLRSAAGRSGQQTASFATVCTNCGAPVDSSNQTSCRYCGAGVASLGPEWVLDDVTADTTPANGLAR